MRSTLNLPEPRTVTSTFIVAAPAETCDIEEIYRVVPESGAVRFDVQSVETAYVRPDGFYLDAGTSADHVRRVRDATRHLLVTVTGAPDWPSRPAGTSRDIATALARSTGGLVLDPLTGSIALPGPAPEADRTGAPRLPIGAWMVGRFDADGERIQLTGLTRFGLPDLYALGVPSTSPSDVVRLLRLVGTGLLYRFWASLRQGSSDTVTIANPMLVNSNLASLRLGDREHANAAGARAYVKLEYDVAALGAPRVRVTCPDGCDATTSEWWHRTATTLLPAAG